MTWRDRLVLTTFFGGLAALHSRDEIARGGGMGLLFIGYAVGHMSLGSVHQEQHELQWAVWLYNRDLAVGR